MLFLWAVPKSYNLQKSDINLIVELLQKLQIQDEFSKENLSKFLKEFADKHNIKYSIFMKMLRSLLSGLKVIFEWIFFLYLTLISLFKEGPSVAEMMELLGKHSTVHRLRVALNQAKDNSWIGTLCYDGSWTCSKKWKIVKEQIE